MSDNDPVVIVGLAIEAPGGVETADDYWTLLSEQREGLGPFPTDRGWALRELFDGSRRNGFKPIHNLGGFLSSATTFDPEFFRISPREATAMDPQQRVGLRVAWRTLENSGINPDDLAGHDVGCYVGASALEYGPALTEFSHHSGHLITGTSLGVISGRIAYTLDLAGPALTVDTSCSSALAAFHTAVQAIDGVSLGDLWSLGFWLKLGKVYVGDRALGRVARDGRIVAHGGQSARIDPLGRLGRRRLTKRDARRCGVTA